MADTVVTVQDRAEAAVIVATSGCRQAKIGDSIATFRVPQSTWKVSEVVTPPNVTRVMVRLYQYHQPGALAETGGQAPEETVVPDIVETFPNVQIRASSRCRSIAIVSLKSRRAHNKRCIPLQSWRPGDFFICGSGCPFVKKHCFIKLVALSTLLALQVMIREGHGVNRKLNASLHPNQ